MRRSRLALLTRVSGPAPRETTVSHLVIGVLRRVSHLESGSLFEGTEYAERSMAKQRAPALPIPSQWLGFLSTLRCVEHLGGYPSAPANSKRLDKKGSLRRQLQRTLKAPVHNQPAAIVELCGGQ
jgi:hypothetical protein